MTKVTKGWYVEAILDDDENQQTPHCVTRVFQVYDAAAQYADHLRRAIKKSDSVNIRTKTGYDKLPEGW